MNMSIDKLSAIASCTGVHKEIKMNSNVPINK